MTETNLIYITCKDKSEAKKIAKELLTKKIIACANIYDEVTSYYRWKEEIKKDKEAILICKTTNSFVDKVKQNVKELHSYECPCVLVSPIETGNQDYINWIKEQVS